MRSLIIFVLILFGVCAGALTAAGYFAIINSVGLINRAADVTGTKENIVFFEEVMLVGATLGTIVSVFDVSVNIGEFFGILSASAFTLVSGMFVGLFAVSIAETTKAIPIFLRRVRLGSGLGIIVLMIALGKAFGHILYYFWLY